MTADNLQNTRMSCGVSRDMRFSNRLTQQKKKDKPSTPSQDDVCDYYRTFGGAARKCIQPCAWPNTKNQSATLASATDHAKGLLYVTKFLDVNSKLTRDQKSVSFPLPDWTNVQDYLDQFY